MRKSLVFLLISGLMVAEQLTMTGWMTIHWPQGGAPAFLSFTIDQAADATEQLWQMPEAATIDTLVFRYTLRTGTPVQHIVSLISIATSGTCTGTVRATAAITPPADSTWDGTFRFVTISHDGAGGALASYNLARGELFCVKVQPCQNATAPCSGAATPDASNSAGISTTLSNTPQPLFPHAATVNNAVRSVLNNFPLGGVCSSSQCYGGMVSAYNINSFASSSTPDEYAMSFNLSLPSTCSYSIYGAVFVFRQSTGSSATVTLYDGTTALQSISLDSDVLAGTAAERAVQVFFDETTLSTLTGNSTYRLAVKPDGATAIEFYTFSASSALAYTSFWGGPNFLQSTRTDSGAWSDDATKRPVMGLLRGPITCSGGGTPIGSFIFIK